MNVSIKNKQQDNSCTTKAPPVISHPLKENSR